jgi:hypothetical protein
MYTYFKQLSLMKTEKKSLIVKITLILKSTVQKPTAIIIFSFLAHTEYIFIHLIYIDYPCIVWFDLLV